MKSGKSASRGPSLRVAVDCTSIEEVLALVEFTKSLGLTPMMGAGPIAPDPVVIPPRMGEKKKKKVPHSKKRPKKYPASMQIRLAEPPPKDAPKPIREGYRKLKRKFGEDPFEKGIARSMKIQSQTMARILDSGFAIPA